MPFSLTLELTIPANTPATAPKQDIKGLPGGATIEEIRLHVPAGHQALQPVWFEFAGGKLLPTDNTQFRLDDVSDLPVFVGKYKVPFAGDLALVGYNLDTAFQHTTRAFVRGKYAGE